MRSTIARMPAFAVAVLSALLLVQCWSPPRAPSRVLSLVAHQDDDLLFINPAIVDAISSGASVKTVFLTAGAKTGDSVYYPAREAAARAAYARMAGAADAWTDVPGPVHEIALVARPDISLMFLRLSVSASEGGGVSPGSGANLQKLWLDDDGAQPPTVMTSIDGGHTYTKQQLLEALAVIIRRFHPDHVATLDDSGLFGRGDDPSGVRIAYASLPKECYFYDHSDHYYSALFARAALAIAGEPATVTRHRGYNMANDAVNLDAKDSRAKMDAFEAYAEHDERIADKSPFGFLYDPWLRRQYLVGNGPGSARVCP